MVDLKVAAVIVETIVGIMAEAEIPVFLTLGTALGAWRHGDFLPHDLDIDLGFLAEDGKAARLILAAGAFMRAGFVTKALTTGMGFKLSRSPFHADLPPYVLEGKARVVYSNNKTKNKRHYKLVYPATLFEHMETVRLGGHRYLAPMPIETYLRRQYGPTYAVPDPEWKAQWSPARVYLKP